MLNCILDYKDVKLFVLMVDACNLCTQFRYSNVLALYCDSHLNLRLGYCGKEMVAD